MKNGAKTSEKWREMRIDHIPEDFCGVEAINLQIRRLVSAWKRQTRGEKLWSRVLEREKLVTLSLLSGHYI